MQDYGWLNGLTGVCRFDDCLPLLDCRAKERLPQNSKSVIVYLFPFYTGDFPGRNVGRYAYPDDYHTVCGGILEQAARLLLKQYPGEEFVPFIDNSPIREVRGAALSGLGVIGGHGMLIHEEYGSRVFIGEIVTSVELPPDSPVKGSCLYCGRCVMACPTNAFSIGKPLERALCRSAISQKKGDLTEWERGQLRAGGLIWGCDLCADACPLNRNVPLTPVKRFLENIVPRVTRENLSTVMAKKSYNWRGEAVLLRNLEIVESGGATAKENNPQIEHL